MSAEQDRRLIAVVIESVARGFGCRCEPGSCLGADENGNDGTCHACLSLDPEWGCPVADFDHDQAELVAALTPPDTLTVTIPAPMISTGPAGMTVIEAAVHYLRDAASRVESNRYWGSGVSALVTRTLRDAADAAEVVNRPGETP